MRARAPLAPRLTLTLRQGSTLLDVTTRSTLPLYLIATATSLFGNASIAIVLPWLVLERTGDPALAGTVAAITAAPGALAAFVGGHLIDKVGRRRMAVLSDVGSALAVAALAVVDARVGPGRSSAGGARAADRRLIAPAATPDSSDWDDDHIAYQLVVGYEAEGPSACAWLNRRIIALMQDPPPPALRPDGRRSAVLSRSMHLAAAFPLVRALPVSSSVAEQWRGAPNAATQAPGGVQERPRLSSARRTRETKRSGSLRTVVAEKRSTTHPAATNSASRRRSSTKLLREE